MANTANSVMTPQNAVLAIADLTAVTACTTRGPTATASLAGANIVIFVPANATGDQTIAQIRIKAASTAFTSASAAQTVSIWQWDGTKAWIIDEILTSVVTPSTTVASGYWDVLYTNLVIPATHALYASTSITTAANTTALLAIAYGGALA